MHNGVSHDAGGQGLVGQFAFFDDLKDGVVGQAADEAAVGVDKAIYWSM